MAENPQGARRPSLSRRKRVAFTLILALIMVALVEVLAALAWRVLIPEEERQQVEATIGLAEAGFNSVRRYRPHPYLNYIGNPEYRFAEGKRAHAPIGIRATDVPLTSRRPGTLRLVAIGGSTTFGHRFESTEETWPVMAGERLEHLSGLDIEVVNAGVINYSTYEIIAMSALWLPEMEADYVLIHTGLNDAFTVGYPDEGGPDGTTFRFSWSHREAPDVVRAAMRWSHVLRLLGAAWLKRGGHLVGDMTRAMQHGRLEGEELQRAIESADGRYFRRNVETLVTLVRRAGAEPVLVTEPLNPDMETGLGLYYDAVSRAVVRNNRILAEVAAEHGLVLVDAYSRMRDPEAFRDAAHVNWYGMEQKTQVVAEELMPVLLHRQRPGQEAHDGTPDAPAASP